MVTAKTVHDISFSIGILFLAFSLMLVFLVPGSQFYTSFVLGTLLVFDYFDYQLSNTSILWYFYNHKHRFAFCLFFFIAFLFCFTVDYLWGVKMVKMWEWVNYGFTQFLRMYLIMNVSFLLSIYELYRVIKGLLKKVVIEKPLLPATILPRHKFIFYIWALFIGFACLFSPAYVLLLRANFVGEYLMLLPFLSISLIANSLTYLTGGKPIIEDILRLDTLKLTSLVLTVFFAVLMSEELNMVAGEWHYLKVPFSNLQLFSIPLAIFIGWIPLALGAISLVNLVKHLADHGAAG